MRNFTETLLCSKWNQETIISEYTVMAEINSNHIQSETLYLQAFPKMIQIYRYSNIFYKFKYLFLRYQRKYT